ncbi:hypothetical protein BX666DRAFT_193047 [Dichotomocladium elegans]|nr:hypothetical protein BX666DRAFT_193047 [Dichotomocladium elegans]
MPSTTAPEMLSFDTCCCGQPNCPRLNHWATMLHKLETDGRLAAEIGQSLLQKHEKYVIETDQTRNELQCKVQEYQERIHALERAAEQSEWENQQEVDQDKAKWYWKWKRTQTTLDATAADLDVANTKCAQLSNALRDQEAEAEKLGMYKALARESSTREESLRTKLDEALQEIEALRKNEKVLETRYRRMKEKHDKRS